MLLELVEVSSLLFILLNPFSLSVYLQDLIRDLDAWTFFKIVLRASCISAFVFILFAWTGDAIFSSVLQVRFSSFLIFGGLIFLGIGLQFVFVGAEVFGRLRGPAQHVAGSIAMPFMIGPGTVSASIFIGTQVSPVYSMTAILVSLLAVSISLLVIKFIHDFVKQRHEKLVERYVDVVGRVTALIVGTIAIEMIIQGVDLWLAPPPVT